MASILDWVIWTKKVNTFNLPQFSCSQQLSFLILFDTQGKNVQKVNAYPFLSFTPKRNTEGTVLKTQNHTGVEGLNL